MNINQQGAPYTGQSSRYALESCVSAMPSITWCQLARRLLALSPLQMFSDLNLHLWLMMMIIISIVSFTVGSLDQHAFITNVLEAACISSPSISLSHFALSKGFCFIYLEGITARLLTGAIHLGNFWSKPDLLEWLEYDEELRQCLICDIPESKQNWNANASP
jgi:hypothetical protein